MSNSQIFQSCVERCFMAALSSIQNQNIDVRNLHSFGFKNLNSIAIFFRQKYFRFIFQYVPDRSIFPSSTRRIRTLPSEEIHKGVISFQEIHARNKNIFDIYPAFMSNNASKRIYKRSCNEKACNSQLMKCNSKNKQWHALNIFPHSPCNQINT